MSNIKLKIRLEEWRGYLVMQVSEITDLSTFASANTFYQKKPCPHIIVNYTDIDDKDNIYAF